MCMAEARFACSLSAFQSLSVFPLCYLGFLKDQGSWRPLFSGWFSGRHLDFLGSLKLLSSPHLRAGDKGLLRGILSAGVWNGFLLGFGCT